MQWKLAAKTFAWLAGIVLAMVGSVSAQTVLPLPSGIDGNYAFVRALAAQDDGRILVGGQFDSINGVSRKNLARLNADGSVDATWSIGGIDGRITAIASHGDRVFIGGEFTHVAGQQRLFLAAIDRNTGELLAWNPSPTYPTVVISDINAMIASTSGATLYVTGHGGIGSFVSLDAETGVPHAPWAGDAPTERGYSLAIIRDGDPARDVLYVGGESGIAAVDTSTGTGLGWHVDTSSPVTDLAFVTMASGDLIIASGGLQSQDGSGYQSVAAFYRANMYLPPGPPYSATQLSWDPAIMDGGTIGRAQAITIHNRELLLAGEFTQVGGQLRNNIARTSIPWSENVKDWYPTLGADNAIDAMVVSGNTIYIGGRFTQVGGEYRYGIAAITASESIFSDGFERSVP